MKAEKYIEHPARVLISGKSGSGKTHLAVQLLMRTLSDQIDRLIVACPTWSTQDVFRSLDHLVKEERDIFEDVDSKTFTTIFEQVLNQVRYTKKNGLKPIRTWLLIDDCGSNSAIHGGRISNFGKIAVQLRHLNVSMIVLVQHPKLVSPNFRENANHFILFPTQRVDEINWINNEFNSTFCSKEAFLKLVFAAWDPISEKGERNEYGQHFLYIHIPQRKAIQFYRDFEEELLIKRIRF
jgi:hypothetical protein